MHRTHWLVLPLAALMLASCGTAHMEALHHASSTSPLHHIAPTSAYKGKKARATARHDQTAKITGGASSHAITAQEASDPRWVAGQYVVATFSENWSDLFAKNGYAEWGMLTKPLVTKAMWQSIAQLQVAAIKAGNTKITLEPMSGWIADKDNQYANIISAATMAEAGVTPTSQVDNVEYTITTTTEVDPAGTTNEPEVMELGMQKIGSRWYVAKQYAYPVG